jgi:hypothetical protein
MAGALRTIALLGALAAVLAVAAGRLPQAAVAHPPTPWPAPGDGDVSIQVETRAVVVAGSPQVTIDIEPCCKCNVIILHRCGSLGVVSVAIITTPQFDATTVDPTTVIFAGAHAKWWKAVDVDHDRDKDLLLTFRTKDTNLAPGYTQACLDGKTYGGDAIHACDSVHVIGLDRWWNKMTAAAASIIRLGGDGGAGGNASGDTGLTAALGASSAPVALPAAGSSGFGFWGDGWPWWAGLLAGAAIAAFVMAAGAWVFAAKRRNGSNGL